MNEDPRQDYEYLQVDDQSQQPTYQYNPQPRKKHVGRIVALVLCCALLAGAAGGGVIGLILRSSQQSAEPSAPETLSTEPTEPETPATEPEVKDSTPLIVATNNSGVALSPAQVYAQNVNAVVSISNEYTTANIFGQISSAASSGSGFLIDSSGYIITNYHVIASAQTLTVTLTNGESYEAELIGGDSDNDVALLKIEGKDFPTVTVGDSYALRVGEMVVAIGNPLGELTNTLTVGYISALDREINTDGTPINMMQTDAAINAGNSGGPLFDMYGNVIGITTAKYASSSVEGLGFAIPINDAMNIIADLKQYGYVTGRPYFGIYTDDLTITMASYYNLPVGVYVSGVIEGAAAANAGMQEGDIICKIDGVQIQTQTELSSVMKKYRAGDTAVITVYRNQDYLDLTITFDEKLPVSEDEEPTQTAPSKGSNGFNSFGFPFFGFGG